MIQIPPGISSPALIRDPVTVNVDGEAVKGMTRFRIIDLSAAKALCKNLLARESGTAYQRLIDSNGKKSRRKLIVFELRRDSGSLSAMSGQSATMRPSRPTHGAIIRSGYAKNLDGFVRQHPASLGIFQAWRGATLLDGRDENGKPDWAGSKISPMVPQAFIQAVHQGSILYMPHAGPLTAKPKRVRFRKVGAGQLTKR